jgi:hypothetical protein
MLELINDINKKIYDNITYFNSICLDSNCDIISKKIMIKVYFSRFLNKMVGYDMIYDYSIDIDYNLNINILYRIRETNEIFRFEYNKYLRREKLKNILYI